MVVKKKRGRPKGSVKKKGPGQPTKCTPEVQERVVQALRGGNYRDTSAAYGGITYDTFSNWMQWGEQDQREPYLSFFLACKKAETEAEIEAVSQVRLASRNPKNWAASMTWLERRYQRKWSRLERTEHTGAVKILLVDETSDAKSNRD